MSKHVWQPTSPTYQHQPVAEDRQNPPNCIRHN